MLDDTLGATRDCFLLFEQASPIFFFLVFVPLARRDNVLLLVWFSQKIVPQTELTRERTFVQELHDRLHNLVGLVHRSWIHTSVADALGIVLRTNTTLQTTVELALDVIRK